MVTDIFAEATQKGSDFTYLVGRLQGLVRGVIDSGNVETVNKFLARVEPEHVRALAAIIEALDSGEPDGELKRIVEQYATAVKPTAH